MIVSAEIDYGVASPSAIRGGITHGRPTVAAVVVVLVATCVQPSRTGWCNDAAILCATNFLGHDADTLR